MISEETNVVRRRQKSCVDVKQNKALYLYCLNIDFIHENH